jgi:hypothetical protein
MGQIERRRRAHRLVAVTRPGRVILVISENIDQCAELFLKIDRFLIRAGVGTSCRGYLRSWRLTAGSKSRTG